MINKKAILCCLVPGAIVHLSGLENAPALTVFFTGVFLWFTEALPLAVTGLLIPVFAVSLGVLPMPDAFGSFGNQVIFLFVGAFILAQAMHECELDKKVAFMMLSRKFASKSLGRICAVTGGISWMLSMWISNTAACAIMTPICLGVISNTGEQKNLTRRLLLTCAFAATIGGICTPVGSPPNVLAMELLAREGVRLSFLDWMLFATPVSFLMLLCLIALMNIIFPLENHENRFEFSRPGRLTGTQMKVIFSFLIAIILWVVPWFGVSMGVAAVIGASSLFFWSDPVFTWKRLSKIDWGTILLFGGGLTLGTVLDESGIASSVGQVLIEFSSESYLLFVIALVGSSILLSEFSSNTASASIIVPIIIAAGLPKEIVLAVTLGVSFGFMLPVSTPPNAVVFGTGLLDLKSMLRAGVLFDLTGLVLISSLILILT